jgi:hypothetical protein
MLQSQLALLRRASVCLLATGILLDGCWRVLTEIPRYPLPGNVGKGYHGIHSVGAFVAVVQQNAKCSPGKQMICCDNVETSPFIA